MADLVDVGNALVNLIATIAYPNGTNQPSIVNSPILVYQGWPNAQQLPIDLKAGKVHISVFPRPNDRTQYVAMGDMDWRELSNNGVSGNTILEVRRQTRVYQITVWANCFDSRDPVASSIDSALALVLRIDMPDGTQGILSYTGSNQDDNEQLLGIYRRDLLYSVNYATTATVEQQAILEADASITLLSAGDITIGSISTINKG
jgi:hypothetical protein